VDVLAQLTDALLQPTSWSTQRNTDQPHGVALRSLPPASTALMLDPLGHIAVKQQVVPLNTARDIEIFGGAPVAGARRFQLSAVLAGTPMEKTPLQSQFAPAQYFTMSDDELLAAPSFETMDAGYLLGSTATKIDAQEILSAKVDYQTITIDGSGSTTQPPAYTLTQGQLLGFARSGAAARAPVRGIGRARFRNGAVQPAATVNAKEWTILPVGDGTAASVSPGVRTWSEYQGVLRTLNRARATWQLIPAYEVQN
jgi:hypothetical protein